MIARTLGVLVAASCLLGLGLWALQEDPAPIPAAVGQSGASGAPSVQAVAPSTIASAGDAATAEATCADLDRDGCVVTGFNPEEDGLSFGNEAVTGTLSAAALMALFGPESVCAAVSEKGCVLYPAAAQWARQVNEAMAGGRSEGIAVLAQRIFDGEVSVDDLDSEAATAAQLAKSNPVVTGAIETWWATQFLPPVREAATASRLYSPSSIVQELTAGLLAGAGYTLAMTTPEGAHSVLPFAVHRRGESFAVSVYDGDHPGVAQEVLVDALSERWSYAHDPASPSGDPWTGGIGTIELTPMSVRALPASAPFDASMIALSPVARGNADSVTLLVTSPQVSVRVGVALTVKGRTIDASDVGARLPRGVTVRRILGSGLAGSGVSVTIDRTKVPSFSAAPLTAASAGSQIPTTISIDSPGRPRITVRSPNTLTTDVLKRTNLARSRGSARDEFPLLAVVEGDTFARGPQVNIANGLNSVNLTLPSSALLLEVGKGADGSAEIRFRSRQGRVVAESSVAFDNPSGRVQVSDFRVSTTGRVVETSAAFARAVPIDTAVLEVLEAVAGGGTAAQSAIAVSNVGRSAVAGTPVKLTSSGGSDTGPVAFVVTGENCAIVRRALLARAPTTCRVTATRSSSAGSVASVSAPVTFIFRAAAQAPLAVGTPTRSGIAGDPIRLTASGGSGGGAVGFTVQGRGCSLVRNMLTASRPGTCIVTAVKSANGIYSAARSSSRALNFTRALQRELMVANAALSGLVGAPVVLTTRGGSGTGAVTYEAAGIGCVISGTTLSTSGAAPMTCTVTARKAASGIYRAAASPEVTFTFN
jgi:hypothetical protein